MKNYKEFKKQLLKKPSVKKAYDNLEMKLQHKQLSKRIKRQCAICGRFINVILYSDGTYRNGHYFGKIIRHEYWECPGCYWG